MQRQSASLPQPSRQSNVESMQAAFYVPVMRFLPCFRTLQLEHRYSILCLVTALLAPFLQCISGSVHAAFPRYAFRNVCWSSKTLALTFHVVILSPLLLHSGITPEPREAVLSAHITISFTEALHWIGQRNTECTQWRPIEKRSVIM